MRSGGLDEYDLLIWRVVGSPHIPDGLNTILREWTLEDLANAHIAIDAAIALTPDPPKPKAKR